MNNEVCTLLPLRRRKGIIHSSTGLHNLKLAVISWSTMIMVLLICLESTMKAFVPVGERPENDWVSREDEGTSDWINVRKNVLKKN